MNLRKLIRIPLVTAAVAATALATALVPSAAHAGSQAPAPVPPRYLLTIPNYPDSHFNVQNAVSGKITANLWAPMHGEWWGLATDGPKSFIGTDLVVVKTGVCDPLCVVKAETYSYRLALTSRGTLARERRVGAATAGFINGLSVTPNGRYAAYLINGKVDLKNMVTGRLIASWPQHGAVPDSLSIDAAGNAVAISAYEYKPKEDNRLLQWTSVLRARTSGTALINLPEVTAQDSAVALSPNGKTVYEFLQTGHVTDTSWQSKKPVTFELAAVDAATGKVVSVLHTWRAAWADFYPQLALAPGGRYLLIVNHRSLARVDLATGQYTALPGKITWFYSIAEPFGLNAHDPSDGITYVDPLAW